MMDQVEVDKSRFSDNGVGKICVRIADISITLLSRDPGLKLTVQGAMKDFLVDEAEADVSVWVAWGDLLRTSDGEKMFDSGALWQLYQQDGTYLFRCASPSLGALPYKVAYFNPDFTSGEVYLHYPYFNCDQPVYPLEYPLDELLMVNLLAKGKGVEVHGCGVVDPQGNGHLFLGQSGAGKTTTAKLWWKEEGVTILSDDRIILRPVGERLWMYGTPWHGAAELACSAHAPLTRIFFLRHGQKNELVLQREADAVGRLFACSFPPFHSPEALDFTLRFFEEVVKAVPCYELRFLPDERVVEFLLEGMKE